MVLLGDHLYFDKYVKIYFAEIYTRSFIFTIFNLPCYQVPLAVYCREHVLVSILLDQFSAYFLLQKWFSDLNLFVVIWE